MPNLLEKEKCTGCAACANKCPQGSIRMVQDGFGFLYPEIDNNTCVNCKLCENACPGLNDSNNGVKTLEAKFVWGG